MFVGTVRACVCVCPALILSFPVMSLLSEGLGRSTTASTHRVEAGIFVNWEAHCAGPGTNSEYPVQSGDQPQHPLGATRTETIGLGQILSSNIQSGSITRSSHRARELYESAQFDALWWPGRVSVVR